MPTEDAYSSGHLVLSHFGTCMCSYVETNLSWTCLVSGPLNFEHPSVLLFCSFQCLWRSEPGRRFKFFFSLPAHIHVCTVTYMTEISLIVTLNNQFTSSEEGWHFMEINILTLKMLKINTPYSSGKRINNLTLTFLQFGGKCLIFQKKKFASLRSQQLKFLNNFSGSLRSH